jgi:tetratricopeptide (TPR) repeat protein
MTKENVLFAIIGVLLGFILGFIFANSASQRIPAPRAQPPAVAQSSEQPPVNQTMPASPSADESTTSPELEEAVEKARSEPNNFDAQVKAGQQLYAHKRYDRAIESFLRANQLRTDDYDTITMLGNTYFDAGQYEQAAKWYTTALAKKPDDINVRTDLGLTFFFRKPRDLERAIKEFRASLKYDPNHEQTLTNLIVVLSEKGDFKEAQAMLAQFEKAHPENPSLQKLRARVEEMAKSTGEK